MISIIDFFGWIGALVSICFFVSPIFNYKNLMKKKVDYKEINILIIVGNYVTSLVWLIYGFENKIKQITVFYSLVNIFYMDIDFLVYREKKKGHKLWYILWYYLY